MDLEALSLATSSSSKVFSKLSMFKSVAEIFLLAIRRNSGGSFVSSTGESMTPYDVGSTPRDFRLRRCDSVVSYSLLSSLRL